jgi:hypothetical protein
MRIDAYFGTILRKTDDLTTLVNMSDEEYNHFLSDKLQIDAFSPPNVSLSLGELFGAIDRAREDRGMLLRKEVPSTMVDNGHGGQWPQSYREFYAARDAFVGAASRACE